MLEQSSQLSGPFPSVFSDELKRYEGTTTAMVLLSSEGGDRVFSRYLRWAIYKNDPQVQWRACFRIEAFEA